jgi:AcrR family transcriptional regulator
MPGYADTVNIGQDRSVTSTATRDSYHHGDLANALAAAALDLARRGGPEAVVLREAARQVGVSPTAAYRHFAGHDALIDTIKHLCQTELVGRMEAELAAGTPEPDPGQEAIRRLRALGVGYLRFAREEPGLFRTAFCRSDARPGDQWTDMLTAPGFVALTTTLDDMVSYGVLDAERRAGAEMVAWSTVHGLAMLLLDGPLGALPSDDLERIAERVHNAAIVGIIGHEPAQRGDAT